MFKKWGWLLVIGVVLGAMAATLRWWWPLLLGFLNVQSATLQVLANFIQIALGVGTFFSWLFAWRLRKKETPQKTEYHGPVATGSGGRAVQAGTYIEKLESTPAPGIATDATTLRRTYLERLFTSCRALSLAGIDPKAASSEAEARLNLDAVYTAMLTRQSEHSDEARRAGKMERETRLLSAVEQLNKHQHLVLLGDPGSGKSTFVNFVALCLSGAALDKPETNLGLLTAPLPVDDERKEKKEQQPQPWHHGPLLPMRVILRDLAARGLPAPGESACADHLWRFIENELQNAGLGDFAPHLHQELLVRGGLLLLDGLDEVPEAEKKREQLKQVVEDFAKTFRKCRILVTSRIYAYQDQAWHLAGFAETTLAPFSKGQIRRFIGCWYDHVAAVRGMQLDDARGRAALLERAVFGSIRLLGLAERPLLLTLMASLHAWRGGTLPEKRVELYADATDLLLDWWEQPKVVRDAHGKVQVQQPSLAQWLQVDREQVRRLINELAYTAHAQQKKETDGTADVSEGELVGGLMRLRPAPEANPGLLADYLSQRAGLLLPRGAGVYTFPHRSFQEYLAACHLTDDDFPEKLADLARSDPDRWREVVLLAAGKSAGGADFAVWALAETLCPQDVAACDKSQAHCWGALLAGQVLAESANLERVSASNRGKRDRVREWLLHLLDRSDFPPVERAAAGNALARLGDPRFRENVWHLPADDLLGFIEIPEGPFLMGSDKKRDRYAVENEECPQHELSLPTYYIGRYPVTVAQFHAFIEATGYKPEDPDCLRGVGNHPVVWVSWHEAMKYCDWLTETLRQWDGTPEPLARRLREENWRFTLPSEAEWEKAARGANGRIFPWGDESDPNKANYGDTGIGRTSPVGCFPAGASPSGCQDMAGNVYEWTRSLWGEEWDKPGWRYPYDPADGRENLQAPGRVPRVVRGGAFFNHRRGARCAFRSEDDPDYRSHHLGFRVVLRLSL